ncbi:MAG: hypothetical protein DRN14_03845 [Thermoplasmata archaeon]|nr:MAG: hypothetical protein DRN14_03845 [Thermoplasmata archaeon]
MQAIDMVKEVEFIVDTMKNRRGDLFEKAAALKSAAMLYENLASAEGMKFSMKKYWNNLTDEKPHSRHTRD